MNREPFHSKINFPIIVLLILSSYHIGYSQEIEGCQIFPANNAWNTRIDRLPVDPQSGAYIDSIGSNIGLHPDFGSGLWMNAPNGIPYTIVSGTEAFVSVSFSYSDESDSGPYPIPPDAQIEGGPDSTGDRHILLLDKNTRKLYELFSAYQNPDGSWRAVSGAIFDLRSNLLRPDGWTSADAAGLPILPGLARYEEVAAGEIKHALRFTCVRTRRDYVWPARHFASVQANLRLLARYFRRDYDRPAQHSASSGDDPALPPMGQRFRLKSSFDISGYSPQTKVILTALKRYGMILADNGANWFISGCPSPGWDNESLVTEFRTVKGSNFEAVDVSSLMVDKDSAEASESPANSTIDKSAKY